MQYDENDGGYEIKKRDTPSEDAEAAAATATTTTTTTTTTAATRDESFSMIESNGEDGHWEENREYDTSEPKSKRQKRCGGLYKPTITLSAALRTAVANFAIHRDIVALVLDSFCSGTLSKEERKICLRDIVIRGVLVGEESLKGKKQHISEILKETEASMKKAKKNYENIVELRRERFRKELAFSGLGEFADSIADSDFDLSSGSGDSLNKIKCGKKYETLCNPHTQPKDRASPRIDPIKIQDHKKMMMTLEQKEAEKRELKIKLDALRTYSAYRERLHFFKHISSKNSEEVISSNINLFADLFLYSFSHSRETQRMVCSEYCSQRPFGLRRLHPSRHYTFMSCMPAIYEHYFMKKIERSQIVILARHLHCYGFVPLLTSHQIKLCTTPITYHGLVFSEDEGNESH